MGGAGGSLLVRWKCSLDLDVYTGIYLYKSLSCCKHKICALHSILALKKKKKNERFIET